MKLKRMSALLLCGTMLAGTLAGCSGSSSSAATSDATAAAMPFPPLPPSRKRPPHCSNMFQPENWSKLSWENGVCMSAQDFSQYLTGNETDLQNDIINALNTASGITGMTYNDLGDSAYKTLSEDSTAEVLSGMISVDDFFTNLQNG